MSQQGTVSLTFFHCIRIEKRLRQYFHRIWIAMEKPLVKRGSGYGLPVTVVLTLSTSISVSTCRQLLTWLKKYSWEKTLQIHRGWKLVWIYNCTETRLYSPTFRCQYLVFWITMSWLSAGNCIILGPSLFVFKSAATEMRFSLLHVSL